MNFIELQSGLIDYANKHHKKESQIYRVVFDLAMTVFFKKSSNFVINTKELAKRLDVSVSYLRQIFYRLTDAGLINFSQGDNDGNKLIFFNIDGVTRLLRNIHLAFQNFLNNKKTANKGPSSALTRGRFWPRLAKGPRKHKPIDKDRCKSIDINTGEITEIQRTAPANNTKRLIRTRFFQSEDFRVSYKKLIRG